MKTALKRLSANPTDIITSSGGIVVKTIILANVVNTVAVDAKVYLRKNGSGEDIVVFRGNVYPRSNVSVYLSKDIQLYLQSGDVLLGTASYFDGSNAGQEVLDVTVSYEGSSTENPQSSSSTSVSSSSSTSVSSSSSASGSFLNYNRSSSNLSSHVNWGLLRGAIETNYENWGAV